MNITEFNVTGMTCANCEKHVRAEVSAVEGVTDIEVSAETGVLRVTSSDELDTQAVLAAVDEAGYTASAA